MPKKPCAEFPDNREFKTIGLAACPDCGSDDCWLHYLRWEVKGGITLNADQHWRVKPEYQ